MDATEKVPALDEVEQAIHEAKDAEETLRKVDSRAVDVGEVEPFMSTRSDIDLAAARRRQFRREHEETVQHRHHDKQDDEHEGKHHDEHEGKHHDKHHGHDKG